jgi:autotransporter-associated beta strand protein
VDGGGSVLTYADDAVLGAGGVTLKNDGTIAPTGVQTTTRTFTLESNGHIRNAAGETYTINGAITGPGLLLKNGEGTLILNTANNYTGGTALNRGTLLVNHDNALGTGTLMIETGTFGTNTAGLVLPNDVRIGSSFTLALPGGATGMSVEGNVDFDFFSPVITVQGGTGSFVRFRGSVTGTSTDVTYVGSPGLTFVIYEDGAVATPNTFAGTTTVNDGVALVLNKSTDNSAILGALVIGSGARVDLRDDEQIADTASLIANSQGAGGAKGFRMDGHNETIGALYGDGTIGMENTSTLVAGTLTVGAGDFSGVISDGQLGGRLVKNSPGTLVLRGINTYVGDTTINGGTLIVDGSVRSANVLINPGAQLAGIGTAYGNVVNRGTFAPGNSPGTFTIGGNYAQQMDGTLVIEIAGRNPGEHDLVVVGGHASLDGTLRIVSVNGFKPKAGDKIQILTAAGGVSGQFSDVDNPFTTGTSIGLDLIYLADQVLLEAVQTSFGDIAGLTPNQKSVGRALDKVAFNPKETELISFLNSQSLEQLPHDFDLIAAEELQAIYSIGISQANIQSGNIARRLDEIRAGAAGFSAAGLAVTGLAPQYSGSYLAPNAGLAGPSGKTSKEIRPPAEENRLGMFVTGVGEWTHIGTTENASGYNLTTGGFTLGLDYKATEHFAFGINAGYARSDARLYGSGNVTVDGGKLGLYATYFNGGFYVDAAVQGGINSYDTRRNALQGTARGSTEGGEVNLLAATGYDWKVGGLTFGPTANFQYTCVAFDGYSERGSLAPLKYSPQSAESVRTAFGVKASYDWHLGGVLLRPEIRAAWQHEFGDQSFGIDAGFANGGGSNFTVNGASIGRDSLLLGGGLAILWNDRISTYVYYDGELARTNYSSNNLTGGFRVSF